MQTTLLGTGIILILALLAALVGPLFIDWNSYRFAIEAEASRVMGVPVNVTGPIDVRLLPTPSLSLSGVEVGAGAAKTVARRLDLELGISALLRGEFRATEVAIDGPDVTISLDRNGNIEIPAARLAFDPERLAIERLSIENGHINFANAQNGAQFGIENVSLSGDVRSLMGPFKAEGQFAAKGDTYKFRLSGSRMEDDGTLKLRLALDPAERPVAFVTEGALHFGQGLPRYDGTLTLTRSVNAPPANGQATTADPWKIAGKVAATPSNATIEQLDVQYGPDGRSVRLAGSANIDYANAARAVVSLTGRQVDIDRVLGSADHKPLPVESIKAFVAGVPGWAPASPLPVRFNVAIDNLVLGGGVVAGLRGDLEYNSGSWDIASLEMRVPGATTLRVGGKLALAERALAFRGPVKVDSTEPTLFFSWVEGKSAVERPAVAPMRASGNLTLSAERVAVDGLDAEIDRKPVQGRLAYRFATASVPARLEGKISAADVDVDRSLAVGQALFASTPFQRPGEVEIAFDVGHFAYAGYEARNTNASLTYTPSGLNIERLSIGDIGGATIEGKGRIDSLSEAPRGSVTMTLSGSRLDGVIAVADKFLPKTADTLRKYGARITPLRVETKLDLTPRRGSQAGQRTAARLKVIGKVAAMDVNLDISGNGELSEVEDAALHVEARVDSSDARKLATLIGLDALVSPDGRPARFTLSAEGSTHGTFKGRGQFGGNDVVASANGTMALSGEGAIDVALTARDVRLPHRAGAVPAELKGHVEIKDGFARVSNLDGKLAGSTVKGNLTLSLAQSRTIGGRIDVNRVDAGELIALLAGIPAAPPAARGQVQVAEWPSEPFAVVDLPAMEGRVEFRAETATWGGLFATQGLAGVIAFENAGFSLSDVTGKLAGGGLALDARFERDANGTSLRSHVRLSDAEIAALLAGTSRMPSSGRVNLNVEVQGQGLSAATLVGALKGSGTMTAQKIELAGLDPVAIETAVAALDRDRGLAANSGRVTDIASAGLDAGRLKFPLAATSIQIADGTAQLVPFTMPAQNATIDAVASLSLKDSQVDVRVNMTSLKVNSSSGEPLQMNVAIKGPWGSARRATDVSPLIQWFTARAAEQDSKALEDVQKERQRLESATESLPQRDSSAAAGNGEATSPTPVHPPAPMRTPELTAPPASVANGTAALPPAPSPPASTPDVANPPAPAPAAEAALPVTPPADASAATPTAAPKENEAIIPLPTPAPTQPANESPVPASPPAAVARNPTPIHRASPPGFSPPQTFTPPPRQPSRSQSGGL